MNAEATGDDEKKLSTQLARRNVEAHTWNTLRDSIFPGAANQSILMAIDYCLARKLDVLKKPCHIVPMQVKVDKDYIWRDVVLPGIYEYRITAQRTGLYLGHTKPEYGPQVGPEGYEAPEYCDMTFFRWNERAKVSVPYPVRVYYREVVGLTKEGDVNARWSKAPIQMLTKCTEAAGLREAFPDEIGGEPTMEEMIDQIVSEQGRREPSTSGSRTESAKEALKAALTDRRGEVNPLAGAYSEKVSKDAVNVSQQKLYPDGSIARELADQQRLAESRNRPTTSVVAEQGKQSDEKPTNSLNRQQFKYDVASGLAYLRMQKTSQQLKAAFKLILDDYEFSGRGEVPLDLEAIYRDLLEAIEEREAIQEQDK